jgi:orotate phosphoribosyltransferase
MNDQDDKKTRAGLIGILLARSFKLGDFTLSSGRKSEYYIDCRTATLHPEGAKYITQAMMPVLAEWKAEQVGGLTLGADPVVAAISMASAGVAWDNQPAYSGPPIPAFIVRKEQKGHGRGKLIEGCFEAGKRTVIVEDVITTGESALKAVAAAREGGAEVVGVIAVVDREEGGREAIEKEGLKVHSLFTATELKDAAQKMGGRRE